MSEESEISKKLESLIEYCIKNKRWISQGNTDELFSPREMQEKLNTGDFIPYQDAYTIACPRNYLDSIKKDIEDLQKEYFDLKTRIEKEELKSATKP